VQKECREWLLRLRVVGHRRLWYDFADFFQNNWYDFGTIYFIFALKAYDVIGAHAVVIGRSRILNNVSIRTVTFDSHP
jgi:hypothetical protein